MSLFKGAHRIEALLQFAMFTLFQLQYFLKTAIACGSMWLNKAIQKFQISLISIVSVLLFCHKLTFFTGYAYKSVILSLKTVK